MNDPWYMLAKKVRPELEGFSGQRRLGAVADTLTLLYSLPLALVGLAWLAAVSDWGAVAHNWELFILLAAFTFLFNRFSFFIIAEIRSGGYANSEGALDGMVLWTAVLLFGPVGLWLDVVWSLYTLGRGLFQARLPGARWSRLRVFFATTSSNLLSTLVALQVYGWLGGTLPLEGFTPTNLLAALAAMLVQIALQLFLYSGYIGYVAWGLRNVMQTSPAAALNFFLMAYALPALANPFAILAAGLYTHEGLLIFLFDMVGLLLVAGLARRLSQAAESSRQQSRQLEELEKLGRAILNAPPDGSMLPAILEEHVPLMFTARGIAIWSEERGILVHYPPDWEVDLAPAWQWLHDQAAARCFLTSEKLPWPGAPAEHNAAVVAPVLHVEGDHPIGGVYIELQTLALPWTRQTVQALVPAVQSLAAQVASALHQAHAYSETLAMQKTLQELSLARRIQDSFLPECLPELTGWQITAALEPARQIAGDFYDFLALPGGKMGVLIADVADKGLGPALYMALSRTLIRTFAEQYPDDPAAVLTAANQRILRDARANLFVTVFYGVLDPANGRLIYANAGHTPPYLFSPNPGVQTLRNTGMPLGIDEESVWRQEVVQMPPGGALLLYTDGVTDAQNSQGEFIDRKLIMDTAQRSLGQPVEQIQQAILDEVHRFVGDAPRFDDITLVILGRDLVE